METARRFVDLDNLVSRVLEWAPNLIIALMVMLGFLLLFRLTRRPLILILAKAGLHDKLVELLVGSVYRYTLMAVGLVMSAAQVGINVAAAIAGLGVAGIAVGFAAQDTLANLIAGIVVFIDKPFVVGDWITVEGQFGKVVDITLRSTRIRTPQNSYVVIPNKHVINVVLENHSKDGDLRIDVPVGIAYKEDTKRARAVLLEAVSTIPKVLADPAPDVVVSALGASSIDLKVRVWIAQVDDRQAVQFAVVETAKRALDAAGIQIPFPHLQLFVDNVEPRVWDGLSAIAGREVGRLHEEERHSPGSKEGPTGPPVG